MAHHGRVATYHFTIEWFFVINASQFADTRDTTKSKTIVFKVIETLRSCVTKFYPVYLAELEVGSLRPKSKSRIL